MEPRTQPSRTNRRTLLLGAAFALTVGLAAGGYLRAGDLFADTRQAVFGTPLAAPADDGEVISYMTDADGRIPDYVVGTDVTLGPAEPPPLMQASYEPEPASAWSTAPSVSGDILAIGQAPSGEAAPAEVLAPPADSAQTHALDASEVAASGATARIDRSAEAPETSKGQDERDRRDAQAALASAGFTTP